MADEIAAGLAARKMAVILADVECLHPPSAAIQSSGEAAVEFLPDADLLACRGAIGHFEIRLSSRGRHLSREAAFVVVATNLRIQPNFQLYGLTPSPFAVSASDFFARMADRSQSPFEITDRQIVFLTGLLNPSNPVVAGDILHHCLMLQTRFKCRTLVLTTHLKVAGTGLEKLYHQAKTAGTIFVKATRSLPRITQDPVGRVRIAYQDEIIDARFEISPALTVVDETLLPSPLLDSIATVFGLETDAQGFLQGDNVHRDSVHTNRRGILVAGPARAIQTPAESAVDIVNAIANAASMTGQAAPAHAVDLHVSRCIHCLTCYRLCPYRAVTLLPRPAISRGACEGCGICVAECPRAAISFAEAEREGAIPTVSADARPSADGSFRPHLLVFCCRRSAMEAYRMAVHQKLLLPEHLTVVDLPCAGALSESHIYDAFSHKADGVLVVTCHPDNCHGATGSARAAARVSGLRTRLTRFGFSPERLHIATVAANMGAQLALTLVRFEKKIMALGPTPL